MFCSSCGAGVARGLSYCNRCGSKLNGTKDADSGKSPELFSDSLIWAIVSVFIVGLGTAIGLMAVMKDLLNFSTGLIVLFTSITFATMVAVEAVLIWLLLSRRRGEKEAGDAVRLQEQAAKELNEAQARALAPPAQSVTEHTTRTFEPIYSERKSK